MEKRLHKAKKKTKLGNKLIQTHNFDFQEGVQYIEQRSQFTPHWFQHCPEKALTKNIKY